MEAQGLPAATVATAAVAKAVAMVAEKVEVATVAVRAEAAMAVGSEESSAVLMAAGERRQLAR